MTEDQVLYRLATAAALGLLIGMQRELRGSPLAGLRTFSLIALSGGMAAVASVELESSWVVVAGLFALIGIFIAGNFLLAAEDKASVGQTTEIAAIVTYLVGVQVVTGPPTIGVVVGGAVAALLYFKADMHGFVNRLSSVDVRAVMQFVLVTIIILPLVPDQTFGPLDVLNPYETWLMVVLIVSINLAGYMTNRIVGEKGGTVLGGILGGLVSSTAATAGFSRQVKEGTGARIIALMIVLACGVSFIRVLLQLGIVAPEAFAAAVYPFASLIVVAVAVSIYGYMRSRDQKDGGRLQTKNPAQLYSALLFALTYSLVKWLVAYGKENFGDAGLYIIGAVSGLTSVNAITLSSGRLVETNSLPADTAWRVILIAISTNLIVKTAMTRVIGGKELFRSALPLFAALIVTSTGLALLWPSAD